MGVNINVPFVPNSSDNLHCLQAVYRMIANCSLPNLDITSEEWDEITGFENGKGTWASAGLLWFSEQGFKVEHWSLFDYPKFVRKGGDYLIEVSGSEVGQWQIEHTNMPLEQKRAEQLLKRVDVHQQEPTIPLIKEFLDNSYLIHALVNSHKLNGKSGYFGHAVVVKGYDDNGFIMHDPGLPPLPDRRVTFKDFESAWAYPNKESKEMDAIKLKSNKLIMN